MFDDNHHIQIFVERWRKCTSKGQLTRILITLVFVPQFFLSSIFWKRIRIQGLVAETWGNRKREIVGSLFSSIFNYRTRWMDGWLSEIWKTGLRNTRSGHQTISRIWDSFTQPRQWLTPQISKGSTRNAKEEEMKQLPERNFLLNFCQLVVRLCPEAGEFIFLLWRKK